MAQKRKTRKRKPSPVHTDEDEITIAVLLGRKEIKALRKALDSHWRRGSRLTLSQAVRWSVTHADIIGEMPDVP